MIFIQPGCQKNAAKMLESQARLVGKIGDGRVYALDGKAWLLSGSGNVWRCEDADESRNMFSAIDGV